MKYVKLTYLIISLAALVFTGCASNKVLFENDNGVTITLSGEPEIFDDGYSIYFKFESPTKDSHLIQQIRMNPTSVDKEDWVGIEAFQSPFLIFQRDHHSTTGVVKQYREIIIMPGTVEGADETLWGFSMLPSGWPETKTKSGDWTFNHSYRKDHKVTGKIVEIKPEYATKYYLNFDKKHLTLIIEGGPTYIWDKHGLIYELELKLKD